MMPIFVPAGDAAMNVRAAALAAAARVGTMSVDAIDPDVSMQMKTLPSRAGTGSTRCGPPSASAMPPSERIQSRVSTAGIQGRGLVAATKNATLEYARSRDVLRSENHR